MVKDVRLSQSLSLMMPIWVDWMKTIFTHPCCDVAEILFLVIYVLRYKGSYNHSDKNTSGPGHMRYKTLCLLQIFLRIWCFNAVYIFFLCRFSEIGRCPFGDKCTQAHSEDELNEWKERFKFRKQQLQKARDSQLHGNTYTEQLMERLTNAESPKAVVGIVSYYFMPGRSSRLQNRAHLYKAEFSDCCNSMLSFGITKVVQGWFSSNGPRVMGRECQIRIPESRTLILLLVPWVPNQWIYHECGEYECMPIYDVNEAYPNTLGETLVILPS